MRADVVRGQRVDQRVAPLSIDFGRPRETTAGGRIGPERPRQRLRQMADPPDAQRLTTLDAAGRDRIAGDRGHAKVGTEKLRRRTNRRPVLTRGIDHRSQRRAGHRTRRVDLDHQRMRTTLEDARQVGGTRGG